MNKDEKEKNNIHELFPNKNKPDNKGVQEEEDSEIDELGILYSIRNLLLEQKEIDGFLLLVKTGNNNIYPYIVGLNEFEIIGIMESFKESFSDSIILEPDLSNNNN